MGPIQRKCQDIVNAIALVEISKKRLQLMREGGWTSLLDNVSPFCERNEIDIPNMGDKFVVQRRGRRKAPEITNLHHYRAEIFYIVIDMQF